MESCIMQITKGIDYPLKEFLWLCIFHPVFGHTMSIPFSSFPRSSLGTLSHYQLLWLWIFKRSFYPSMQHRITGLSVINRANARFVCLFLQSLSTVLFVSNGSLVLLLPFRYPFCFPGSRLLFSRNWYNDSETTSVISFHISGRQEIGLKFSTILPFLGSFTYRYVLQYVIHSASCSVLFRISFIYFKMLS